MGKRKGTEATNPKATKKSKVSDEATSKGRKGDPFRLPPTEYHLAVFRAVEPLVRIWRTEQSTESLGKRNKFYGGLMRADTLDYIIDLLSDRLTAVKSIYTKAKSEGNMRPYHLALVEIFHCISTPSTEEFVQLARKFRWNKDDLGLEALHRLQQNVRVDHDNEGFVLDYKMKLRGRMALTNEEDLSDNEDGPDKAPSDSEDSSKSDKSHREGFYLDNEAPPVNELDTSEAVRTDIKFRTHKRSVLSDPKRPKESLQTQFCPLIAECKKDKENKAVYHDVGYSRIEMRANIQSGHYDPMYLPIFADQSYTYSILDVHAQVQMTDNKISYEAYKESCQEKGVEPLGERELTMRINDGLLELQQWPDLDSKRYPDGKYLVGDFYMEDEWYPLPGEDVSSPGARNFVEAMLRIVVGDSVLSWTANDARVAHKKNQEFIRLMRQANGNPRGDPLRYLSQASTPELHDLAVSYFQKLSRVCLELKSREGQRFMDLQAQPDLRNVLEVVVALLAARGMLP